MDGDSVRARLLAASVRNPPNGSWGIVQIQPTTKVCRRDLEIPPTAVGGISESCHRLVRESLAATEHRLLDQDLQARLRVEQAPAVS
jgi:hypothetical protein